jgi:site-specific DNA-methyltransferase (adenine-specific)
MSTPYYVDDRVTVYHGDALAVLPTLPDQSVDAVVTDPPYGLEFMGREWDRFIAPKGRADLVDHSNFKPTKSDFKDGVGTRVGMPKKNPRCNLCARLRFDKPSSKCDCSIPDWDTRTREYAQDYGSWCEQWAVECLRVLKPGGFLLAFGGTRTWHRLTCAIEDAGFEIRDTISWLYGSGFPKSLDVSKAIDKAAGAEREVISPNSPDVTAPTTDAARRWSGWGTALKPGWEPIVMARKPLAGTVAANVQAHGTGALNIDGCRVGGRPNGGGAHAVSIYGSNGNYESGPNAVGNPAGRWPPNVMLTHATDCQPATCAPGCPVAELDQQSGTVRSSGLYNKGARGVGPKVGAASIPIDGLTSASYSDSGGASQFFPAFRYEPKADSAERPSYYRPTCECEDAWPTTSHARATDATAAAASLSTSKSGNGTTGGESPKGTISTTSTATSSTTTPPTSNSSPSLNISASTPAANSATGNGGSPVGPATSPNPSTASTGTSPAKAGRSTVGAAAATSPRWSATSVCGSCGAPSRREAHATVKPLELMRWLVRLITPPGGLVLDPFVGSGTTAEACTVEGFRCIAVEREPTYLPLIRVRLAKPIQDVLPLVVTP